MTWSPEPAPDARPREGPPPARERLEALSRAIRSGRYEIDSRRVAEAMLKSRGRSGRRG